MAIINLSRPLVLATASEARRKLVADVGLEFTALSVDIDETPQIGEDVAAYVERLARSKADAVTPPTLDAAIVTVDTAIGLGAEIIGKPKDEAHARDVLGRFSGRSHVVLSAIALRDVSAASVAIEIVSTEVKFASLDESMIDWYIETGEWKGRAGGYAIQGKGAALVETVNGCFTNVIGLSMPVFLRMLGNLESVS